MPSLKYDFHSPYMTATIITSDGVRIPLWMQAGAAVDQVAQQARSTAGSAGRIYFNPMMLRALPYLTELTVSIQLAHLPIITAVLNPPYRQAMELLNSPIIEWGQSTLEVQFGYTAGAPDGETLSPVYSGVLLKPDVQIGEDVTITLNAHGVGGFSAARQEGSQQPFNNATRAAIIQLLAEGRGMSPARDLRVDFGEVMDTGEQAHSGDPLLAADTAMLGFSPEDPNRIVDTLASEAYRLLFEDQICYAPGHKTDWLAIWELVREAQCSMIIQGRTIFVFPLRTRLTSPPTRTFRMYDFPQGRIGTNTKTYPILGVSSPNMAVYMPGAIRGLVMRGVGSVDGVINELHLTDQTQAPARVGNADGIGQPAATPNLPGTNSTTGAGETGAPGDPTDSGAVAQARAEYQSLQSNMGINLEIDSIGIPDILPGEVVHVEGLGIRLVGNYGILKIDHTIGGSGMTTRLTTVSNVGMLLQQGDPAAGPVNSRAPTDSGQGGSSLTGATNNQSVRVPTEAAR